MASLLRPAAPDVPEALATITVKLALSTAVVVGAAVVGLDVPPPASTAMLESTLDRIHTPSRTAMMTTMAPRAAVLAAGRGGGRRLTPRPLAEPGPPPPWPCGAAPAAGAG